MSEQKKKSSLFGDMGGFGLKDLKSIDPKSKKEIKETIASAPTPEIKILESPKTKEVTKQTDVKNKTSKVNQQEFTQSIKITSSNLEIKKKTTKVQISFRIAKPYEDAFMQVYTQLKNANPEADLNKSDVLVAVFVEGLKAVTKE